MLLFEALTGRLDLRLVGGDAPSKYLPKLLLDALLLRDGKKLPPGFDDEKDAAVGSLLPIAWMHADGDGRGAVLAAVAKQNNKRSGLILDAECDTALTSAEGVDMKKKDVPESLGKFGRAALQLALSIGMLYHALDVGLASISIWHWSHM